MEKNDALKAQSENGDALGGLSTEEIERLENYYIWEAERLMAVWGAREKGTFRGYVETLAYRGKPITQFTISVGG